MEIYAVRKHGVGNFIFWEDHRKHRVQAAVALYPDLYYMVVSTDNGKTWHREEEND